MDLGTPRDLGWQLRSAAGVGDSTPLNSKILARKMKILINIQFAWKPWDERTPYELSMRSMKPRAPCGTCPQAWHVDNDSYHRHFCLESFSSFYSLRPLCLWRKTASLIVKEHEDRSLRHPGLHRGTRLRVYNLLLTDLSPCCLTGSMEKTRSCRAILDTDAIDFTKCLAQNELPVTADTDSYGSSLRCSPALY